MSSTPAPNTAGAPAAPGVPPPLAPRRRLLLLLHGGRIYDETVHAAVKEMQDAGHEVRARARCATASPHAAHAEHAAPRCCLS